MDKERGKGRERRKGKGRKVILIWKVKCTTKIKSRRRMNKDEIEIIEKNKTREKKENSTRE